MPFTKQGAERSISEVAHLWRRISTLVIMLMFVAVLLGCGSTSSTGQNPPPPVTVSITIDPASGSLFLGQTQQFGSTVTGTTNTLVTWSVNGITGGNPAVGVISTAGLYAAAQILPNPASVTIMATSQADPSKSATATVTVKSDVALSLLPTSVNLGLAVAQFFTESMKASGNPSLAITWSVNGIVGGNPAVGTIVAASFTSALYTAPSTLPSPSTVSITARSVADPSATANAAVTLQCSPNSISPSTAGLGFGKSQTFTAILCVPATTQFVWDVNGIAGGNPVVGTIVVVSSNSAVYTAPSSLPSGSPVTVSARSAADPTTAADAAVSILCDPNTISPSAAGVGFGKTQIFTATLCVPTVTQIVWDVNGIIGGSPTIGTVTNSGTGTTTYTAPGTLPSTNPVTIRATSQSNPVQSANAGATVTDNISVTISPGSLSIQVGHRALFSANVANAPSGAVAWAVNGIANGNSIVGRICVPSSNPCAAPPAPVSGSVEFLAPNRIPSPNSVQLTATSQTAPAHTGSAQVTITPSLVSVSVSPAFVFLGPANSSGSTQQFVAQVSGTLNPAVTWSLQTTIDGQNCTNSLCGTISGAGFYSAPAVAPSPNGIEVIATSQGDPTQLGMAIVAVTSGPTIETLLPSSVLAGVSGSFTLAVQGINFVAGSGSAASAILVDGVRRTTACPNANRCTTTLLPADTTAATTHTVQIQNPGSSGALTNPAPFLVVAKVNTQSVISLSSSAPAATGTDFMVVESTTAGATTLQLNVDFGSVLSGSTGCSIQANPIIVTRPASGTKTVNLCVHGNFLDPSFQYEFSGPSPNDMSTAASAISNGFPNLVHLILIISSTTLPGPRTLFITTANNDKAVATGILEIQ
jgi:hypothetical protein